MTTPQAFICDAIRTPFGRYGGALSSVRTDDLGAIPIRALMERNPGVGKPVSLTEEQAYYPLIAGEIRRPGTVAETDPAAGKPKKA